MEKVNLTCCYMTKKPACNAILLLYIITITSLHDKYIVLVYSKYNTQCSNIASLGEGRRKIFFRRKYELFFVTLLFIII